LDIFTVHEIFSRRILCKKYNSKEFIKLYLQNVILDLNDERSIALYLVSNLFMLNISLSKLPTDILDIISNYETENYKKL
jgi:hypothetical protein